MAPWTSTVTRTSRPTPAADGAAAVAGTFQVLSALRWANSSPLAAVVFDRSAACHHGGAPPAGMSSAKAVQRAPSIADSKRSVTSKR